MLEQSLIRLCTRLHVTSWRAFLAHVYICQLSGEAHEAFEACFVLQRDARWCRRFVRCRIPDRTYILWPPMTTLSSATTDVLIIHVAPHVYIPVVKRFMDPVTLRHCLALYEHCGVHFS
jgi:hypothetical protein